VPSPMSLRRASQELRLLLLYLGLAWGLGAFLVLPADPALTLLFLGAPGLTAATLLKDTRSTIAFCASASILAASAALWHGEPQAAVTIGAILLVDIGIAGVSMLQRAILAPAHN